MRFRWGHLEILGGILAIFGTFLILPGCSFSYYYSILQCVGPATVYDTEGDTGFVIAVAGAVLFVIGEVGRHSKPSPNPPVT